MHDTCTARTPRALLRRTPRAAASFLAVLRLRKQRRRYAPCSRFSPRRLPPAARGATVLLTPALKGAAKGRAVLASSCCAASVRCGRRIVLVPSFASPGEVQRTVRCQRSSRRTGQRGMRPGCPRLVLGCQQLSLPRGAAQRAVAALWAPCFGPIRPTGAKGVQQATPAARICFNVSGQAEGSIVTPQNLSRARLAMLGGCATLDRTCGAPAEASRPGRKHAGGKRRQGRASELPCGDYLQRESTAEAACRARRQSARASGLHEVLAGGFCRLAGSVGQRINYSSL